MTLNKTAIKWLIASSIIIVIAVVIFLIIYFIVIKPRKNTEHFEQGNIISNFNVNTMDPLNFDFTDYTQKANENEILMKNKFNVTQNRVYNDKDYEDTINKALMENSEKLNMAQRQQNAVMLARSNTAIPRSEDVVTGLPQNLERQIERAASEQFVCGAAKYDPVGTGMNYSNAVHNMFLDSKDINGQQAFNLSIGDYTGLTPTFKDGIDPVANIKSVGLYGIQAAGVPPLNSAMSMDSVLDYKDFLGRSPVKGL